MLVTSISLCAFNINQSVPEISISLWTSIHAKFESQSQSAEDKVEAKSNASWSENDGVPAACHNWSCNIKLTKLKHQRQTFKKIPPSSENGVDRKITKILQHPSLYVPWNTPHSWPNSSSHQLTLPPTKDVCEGHNLLMPALRSHADLALMKYVRGRLYWGRPQTSPSLDEVCEGQTVLRSPTDFAITWWSMWGADCTEVAHRLHHHLMKYVRGRLYWGCPQTSPSLDEVCEKQTVLRLPTDFTITWWSMWRAEISSDCTKVTYRPCLDKVCEGKTVPR